MDELTNEFLAESTEGLDRMERGLAELERRPEDSGLLGDIFRAVHTIKGATGFLGLPRLEGVAHAGEHLLGLLRDGRLKADTRVIDGLLALLDRLRTILRLIEQTSTEGNRTEDNDSDLIKLLNDLASPQLAAVADTPMPIVRTAPTAPIAATVAPQSLDRDRVTENTVRIDVDVLNRMMNLVGELVLTRNQMMSSDGNAELARRVAQRLDSVTVELRETVMRARLQPVGNLFGKFPRIVRSIAQSCGRQVRLECSGQDTALDRSVLEQLKDPLMHAVRNAIDHGIEPPAARVAAGKPVEGTVKMRASHQGGSVVIEVEDDGRGMDPARLKERAVQRGLISAERAQMMSDQEAIQLVFLPGFSTCDDVTLISGRGVGMDVVRANVMAANGTVDLQTRPGVGTTIEIRVPLTLAIIPALVVKAGGQSFALPQSSLSELLIVNKREEHAVVVQMGTTRLYRLRDRLVPLVRLADLLGLTCDEPRGYYIAVVECKGEQFGLVVDDLRDPQEIVVKPLTAALRSLGVYTGASALGGGDLALVLDVDGLAARAGLQGRGAAGVPEQGLSIVTEREQKAAQSFVVYEDVYGARTAVPTDRVERIECLTAADLQNVAGHWMLPYRKEVLYVEGAGAGLDQDPTSLFPVLILAGSEGERRRALLVRKVQDIAPGDTVLTDDRAALCMVHVAGSLATLHSGSAAETATPWRIAA